MSRAATPAGAAPDVAPDWHSINWKAVYRNVRRLQARIVKAVREGRWNKVKALVYLLTHSYSGRALAILRVVSNSGARTPGVDGILWNTPEVKSAAFTALRRHGYRPQPLRRVYIPKSNGNLSEGYVQRAKIAYREDEAPVIERWERKALDAATHAASLESENDEAHGLVKERRARLDKLVSQ
jgi:N-terminal domain of reverse transcriptase